MKAMTCIHHWLIEAPNGPTSKGRCKKCGEKRDDFINGREDMSRREWTQKVHSGVIVAATSTGWRIIEGRKE